MIGVHARGETGFWHRGLLPDGPNTIFEIGSITKTFTTTLLADMARDGVVALDDPVQRHVPKGVRLPVRGNDMLYGHDGNDTHTGLAGLDALIGGAGANTLDGGLGADLSPRR